MLPKIGPRYGTNSVNQDISARDHLSGRDIPHRSKIRNIPRTTAPIYTDKNN